MTVRAKVLEDALSLPEADQRWLTEMLVDRVPREPQEEIDEAWRRELVRRLEQVERGEAEIVSAEEVRRRLAVIIGD